MAKGVGFFLLPVYTRIFSPADYGTIAMLTVLNNFLGSILVMGMDSAQSFYFFEQKKNGTHAQSRMISAIFQWRITCGVGIVFAATFFSPLLNKSFFGSQLSWEYFAIAFSGSLFTQLMNQSAEIFRLLYRPWGYIGITIGQTLGSATIALTLILGFGFGIIGFFIGMLSGSIIAAIFGWWRIRRYLDWSKWHRDWWPKLIKFGAPLVPAGIAMYVLDTSDKWFISHYCGQSALGLYAVGAKFSMLIAMAVTTFRQAWWPVAMDAMHSKDGPTLYRTIARLYIGGGTACVVIITAGSPFLVQWLTAPEYANAYPIVGILAWHSIFYGFYLIGAAGIWKAKKTAWTPFLMGAAAILNVILNSMWVPVYGGHGAAAATSVSFLFWNVLSLYISEKLWKIGYPYIIMIVQITIGVITSVMILYIYNDHINYIYGSLIASTATILLGLSAVSQAHIKLLCINIFKKKI